jgi:hypothetical protein
MNKKLKKILITILLIIITILLGLFVAVKLAERAFFNFLTEIKVPSCDGMAIEQINLGDLRSSNETMAEFSTIGGDLYILPQKISPVSVSDFANSVEITIGSVNQRNLYNLEAPDNIKITAIKNRYNQINLTAGRYWLSVSRFAEITLASCNPNGVSNPRPVK